MGSTVDVSLRVLWLQYTTPSQIKNEKPWKYVNDNIKATNKFGEIKRVKKGCFGKFVIDYKTVSQTIVRVGGEPITIEFLDI